MPVINNETYTKKGIKLSSKMLSKIHNSPLRVTEQSFNSLSRNLRNLTGVTAETFKKHLDKWMMKIPDQPKCKGYEKFVSTKSNAICNQVMVKR